jgi:hypothetical protein
MKYNQLPLDYNAIDPECRELVLSLNNLPGVVTSSCCCGHNVAVYGICFKCTNQSSLEIILNSIRGKSKTIPWFNWMCVIHTGNYDELCYSINSVEGHVFRKYIGKTAYSQAKIIAKKIKRSKLIPLSEKDVYEKGDPEWWNQ